ncbi:TetR family transcriptional regulator [Zafaria sp. J156]|uniref:TetR family transcriptional regulator n=1 Tax=Zafaria sp. J156 TaxID=3116490 RepID=UPI002E76880C|nr:TetR family transcriptional regulator [Zafaria sp. J156]MEE1622523.1 TetR family transcriptional regulator [Zafaria sp. J156]
MTAPSAIPEDALRLLVEQGFDATSVDQLAAAAGISRSTFFRRYGTKEDMVFADLESVLAELERTLAAAGPHPGHAAVAGALGVFDHHAARPEASLLRHRLLQEVPALRDRELVSTHRYERAFRHGLAGAFRPVAAAAGEAVPPACIAFCAGVVAVHNAYLRRWLSTRGAGLRAELEGELRALAGLFAPYFAVPGSGGPGSAGTAPDAPAGPPPGTTPGRGPVVVTVLDPGAGTEDIVAEVRRALGV